MISRQARSTFVEVRNQTQAGVLTWDPDSLAESGSRYRLDFGKYSIIIGETPQTSTFPSLISGGPAPVYRISIADADGDTVYSYGASPGDDDYELLASLFQLAQNATDQVSNALSYLQENLGIDTEGHRGN